VDSSQEAAYQEGAGMLVSPQPVLSLSDIYGNPFDSQVQGVRIYIFEVVRQEMRSGLLTDVPEVRDVCTQYPPCWEQVDSYVRFTSLSIDIKNVDFPRDYVIHFEVTASGTTHDTASQEVRVASAAPLLSLSPIDLNANFPARGPVPVPKLGLKWRAVGDTSPADGAEIINSELQAALVTSFASTFEFVLTREEFDACAVSGLANDSYIRVFVDGQNQTLRPLAGVEVGSFDVRVVKDNLARVLETDIANVNVDVSLVGQSPLGRKVHLEASSTVTTLVAGVGSFSDLRITSAGKYTLGFNTGRITMKTAPNFYFTAQEDWLTLSAHSTTFEVTPGELSQIVILQQPHDVRAIVGCYDDLPCDASQQYSYPSLKPFPVVAPADEFGNGRGGHTVSVEIYDPSLATLVSESGAKATSGTWALGGKAVFTDLFVVPEDVERWWLHRLSFHVYDEEGSPLAGATSDAFTAAYLAMDLTGHLNMPLRKAGNELAKVEFRAVDDKGKHVLEARSPVSAAIFQEDGAAFGVVVTRLPQDDGMVKFTEMTIKQVGRYYLRFTYLDLEETSSVFEIVSGNAVSLSFSRQPNNVHVNQVMVPAPIVVMLDNFGNQVVLEQAKTVRLYSPKLDTAGISLKVGATACKGSSPCILTTDSSSQVTVVGLRISAIASDVTLVFRADLEQLTSVASAPFAATAREPVSIRGSWNQPSVRVDEWLNELRVEARDESSKLLEPVDEGTLQSGGLNFVVLAASARSDDDYFKGMMLLITSGPGVGQQAKITAYNGASRQALVTLHRQPTSRSQYAIQYVAKLALASFNGLAVDLRASDTLYTDTFPPKQVPAFVGPDEAFFSNGAARFVGISMQRSGTFSFKIWIDLPPYLGGRVEYKSQEFEVLPGDPTGFYVSQFNLSTSGDELKFSADHFIPSFFAHVRDAYGNNVMDNGEAGAVMRLEAAGGVFAPRAPGFEIQRNENPFDVLDATLNASSVTLAVASQGKAVFDGLRVQTAGRGFRFLISAQVYAPVATLPFEIFPGEATRIIVLRQPLDFKLDVAGKGVIPKQPRICVLDAHDNSLVVKVRVDLLRGQDKCGTLESLREQGLADLFGPDYTCSVVLSDNPYVDSREGIDDGTAEFTDLAISQAADNYVLQFRAQDMRNFEYMDELFYSEPFSVVVGDPFRFMLKNRQQGSFCPALPSECLIAGDTIANFSMIVVDAFDNHVAGKSFQGLRCQVQVPAFLDTSAYRYIGGEAVYVPVLSGTTIVDVQEGVAVFTDLVINQVSTFLGVIDDPTIDVQPGSWVLEFTEPPVNASHPDAPPSLFPGNTFTSEPFKVSAGDFFALGVNGFGSSQVYISTEMPILYISGIDRLGNFVGGAEGIVRLELSGVEPSVRLEYIGKVPANPSHELLDPAGPSGENYFKNRELIDGRATFDGLLLLLL